MLAAICLRGHLRLRVWSKVGIHCLVISQHGFAVTADVGRIRNTSVHVPQSVVVEMCTAEDASNGSLTHDESPSGGIRSMLIFLHDSLP